MKRVYALYRVSTAKQVDRVSCGNTTKDDIPMQRIACHNFAERQQDWEIIREFEEKGVSGFKVSAENRDAIQDLKEAALHHEFDVLLVFMFDRLGRIENETPFVLQWFAEHGVEVWSVNEGQQKFEHHVDKLMNYIRFWQASGESEKTSIRVKTKLEQMTEEGLYTGGAVPFGYTLVYNGRKNKKGQEMRDFAIEPHEAELVRQIFRMTVNEGYGSYQLAEYANSAGFKTHNDAEFQNNTIRRILKNEIYIGYIVNGNAKSNRIEALRIVSDEDFAFAQEILSQRARVNDDKRTVAMSNKGKALLSGNIFCAHCGCRLATSRYKERYIKRDGTASGTEYTRYICYHRSRGLNDCDGSSTYNTERVDNAVLDIMRKIFANISGCPEEEKIQEAYKNAMAANHAMQKKLETELQKNVKQLESLRGEIAKSLIGESIYNKEDLSLALDGIKSKITENEQSLAKLKDEDNRKKLLADSVVPAYRQFKSWSEEFEDASLETKKMIACQLFSRVEVGKGYKVKIVMNMTYRQFVDAFGGEGMKIYQNSGIILEEDAYTIKEQFTFGVLTKYQYGCTICPVIVLQILARPATRGVPAGTPFLFSGGRMAKPFLTYAEQIVVLEKEKLLIVPDHVYAERMLQQIGYFALVGGYKLPFKNPTTRKYRDGTTFNDIVALYKFDENLRELFLKYILRVERNIRSLLSYYFTEKFGEKQEHYLNKANYTTNPHSEKAVNRLIKMMSDMVIDDGDYPYINHYRNVHKNVPLWVLINAVTLGTLSKFYSLMTDDLKT